MNASAGLPIPPSGRSLIRLAKLTLLTYLLVLTAVVAVKASAASGDRSAVVVPHPPSWWLRQAACIRSHEGWTTAATGNGYEGAYQFLASTYASVGGRVLYDREGRPWHWASLDSLREQTFRAWLVWRRDNGSWREWGTAGMCGLR